MTSPAPDIWQNWLDRHGPALVLLARQFLPSPQAAEDAVQDGFIRFWKSRATARDPLPYLFACVRTAALDLLRSEQRRRRRDQTPAPASTTPTLTSPAELAERRRTIEDALAALPPDQREVLVLKIWAGLTFAQIAQTLAIPPNTAAARYRYALQRLEKNLTREMTYE